MKKKDTIVDMNELLWDILICFKPAVVCILIITLLFMAVGYKRNLATYEEEKSKSSEDKIYENLTADERMNVEFVLKVRSQVADAQDYTNNALYMKINPTGFYRVSESYFLEVPEGQNATAVGATYTAKLYSKDILKQLATSLNQEDDIKYLNEVMGGVNVEDAQNATQTLLRFNVNLPTSVDAEKFSETLTQIIEGPLKKSVEKTVEHKLTKVESTVRITSDGNITSTQNTYISNLNNQKNILQTRLEALSSIEKSAYDAIVAIESEGDNTEGTTAQPGFFSMKYCVVGVICGFIFVFLTAFCLQLFGRRIDHVVELENCGANCIGEFWGKDFDKGMAGFIYSKGLYQMHHKAASSSVQELAKRLSARMEALEGEDFMILPAQKELSPKVSELLKELSGTGNSSVHILDGVNDAGQAEDAILASKEISKNLIILAEAGTSLRDAVSIFVDSCDAYGVTVEGAVLIDG